MTLPEVTYSLLEIIREANIVDDERIDLRLLEKFAHAARAESIVTYLDTSKEVLDNTSQYLDITMGVVTNGDGTIVKSTTSIPKPIETRFGLVLQEVYSADDLLAYPLSVVPFNRLRFCGLNQFNKNNIFVAYRDSYLYAKASNDTHKLLEDITIKIVLNDPTEDPAYSKDTDEYPINNIIYGYIKDKVISSDVRKLMLGVSDEVNDATGDIVK